MGRQNVRAIVICLYVLSMFIRTEAQPGGCLVPYEKYTCPQNQRPCTCIQQSDVAIVNCSREVNYCGTLEGMLLKKVPAPLPIELTAIDLNNNLIKAIRRDDFQACHQLRVVILRLNHINHIEVDSFRDLSNVQSLQLNLNKLNLANNISFPYGILDPLTAITDLRLHCNHAEHLKHSYREDLFRHKPALKSLSLDGVYNALLPVPHGDIQLHNLTAISIYRGIDVLKDQFVHWKNVPIEILSLHSASDYCHGVRLSSIHPDVFLSLTRVVTLDLGWNPHMDFSEKLTNGLRGLKYTKIKRLFLQNIYPGKRSTISLPERFFQSLANLSLRELYLDANGISNIDNGFDISDYLPDLQVLSLSYNRLFANFIRVLDRTENLTSLEEINMASQTRRTPGPPMLGDIWESFNITVHLPRNLHYVRLSDGIDYSFPVLEHITVYGGSRNITLIDLSSNLFRHLLGPLKFKGHYSSRHVHTLNLSACGIICIGPNLFPRYRNLTLHQLDLSNNWELGQFILDDKPGHFMKQLSHISLEVLNLSMTNIKYLRPNFFEHINTLTHLVIENNAICDWCPSLSGLSSLKYLDISNNKFISLPKIATDFIDERIQAFGQFELDVSTNPLVDECDSLPFIYWLRHSKVKLFNAQDIFFAKRFPGNYTNLMYIIQKLEIHCASKTWVIVTGSFCFGMMLATIAAISVNRNKWTIKYFCIQLSRRRKGYEIQENDDAFQYDAFVAYHNSSLHWVVNELRQRLETMAAEPITLCLHHRDWLPGIPIEENILSSIKKSRKTIVVLTRHFLRSNWCDFELQMARLRGFDEGQDIVVVVALEDIPINEMNETLINIRRSNTWLELPQGGHEDEVTTFWDRLVKAIRHPSSQPTRCSCGRTFNPDGTIMHDS